MGARPPGLCLDGARVQVAVSVSNTRRCARHSADRSPGRCACGLQTGSFSEDMIPTVGFNMRKVTKGNVAIKVCFLPWATWNRAAADACQAC